jgi:DnaK suppressor protein
MLTMDFTLHRRRLLALRARLRGIMSQMTNHPLMEVKTTTMPNHMAELGTGNFNQELTFSLLGSEKDALDQIEGALKRIEDGSYGGCEICGARIPKSRLQAIPYAAQCIACAAELEDPPATFDSRPRRRVLPR